MRHSSRTSETISGPRTPVHGTFQAPSRPDPGAETISYGPQQLHHPIHDTRELKGNNLIRHHYVARDVLFHPLETGDCPKPLAKDRVTKRGRHCHQDRWRTKKPTEAGDEYWTVASPRSRCCPDSSLRSTLRLQVNETSEGCEESHDRIAFTEAKTKELRSFFTNKVWEFSRENEATPGRILKDGPSTSMEVHGPRPV